jgi:hypothetical protein
MQHLLVCIQISLIVLLMPNKLAMNISNFTTTGDRST